MWKYDYLIKYGKCSFLQKLLRSIARVREVLRKKIFETMPGGQ